MSIPKTSEPSIPTIAWSEFALKRHRKGSGRSYPICSYEAVLNLVKISWSIRFPGKGETDLSRKVVVPLIKTNLFRSPTVKLRKNMKLRSYPSQRQEGEDLFVATYARKSWFEKFLGFFGYSPVELESPEFVSVVLYHKEALLENNGTRSSDADWEIVALICSDVPNEPMMPLTMARNMLEKVGGTKSTYTAEEFAEAIYYWSQRVNWEE